MNGKTCIVSNIAKWSKLNLAFQFKGACYKNILIRFYPQDKLRIYHHTVYYIFTNPKPLSSTAHRDRKGALLSVTVGSKHMCAYLFNHTTQL